MIRYGEELKDPFVTGFEKLVDRAQAIGAGHQAAASYRYGLNKEIARLCLDNPSRQRHL